MRKQLLLLMFVLILQPLMAQQSETPLDWKLGSQAYTFRLFSFAETLDKLNSIDIDYVEAFPGQEIGGGIEGRMDFNMDAATRQKVQELLDSKGIKMVAYGVVTPRNEQDWKDLFAFGKAMGVKVITSEPRKEELDLVNRLAGESGITLALHNHPQPSIYWNPETVLDALEGHENIKACADVGHWVRSGLDPLESLKKLEGKIAILHFKDLNEKSKDAHDVPWGTGISNVKAMLQELKRQNFEGIFSVEYEYKWENSLPEVEESVKYFRKVASTL